MNTNTGSSPEPARLSGDATDRKRQSSDSVTLGYFWGAVAGQAALEAVASRGELHAPYGCEGRHRRSPTGGLAYGMPLKTATSGDSTESRPRRVPRCGTNTSTASRRVAENRRTMVSARPGASIAINGICALSVRHFLSPNRLQLPRGP